MTEDIQRKVRNTINEIEEKAADGDYIYRGEHEWHEQVSSSLWRQFQVQPIPAFFDGINTYDKIQESYLRDARRYGENHPQDNLDLASELQHVGGSTNLIDFTECHLVALFFACDGAHDKPGRVILFERTEDKKSKYKIEVPRCPKHRVTAQKSVFVQHRSGIIDEDDIEEMICIRPSFKQPILTYLRERECIYTQKIYNDLQGYIKHQKIHRDAYNEYRRGHLARLYMIGGLARIDGIDVADAAIKRHSKAIELNPDFVEAYFDRAHVYLWKEDFDKAIKDLTSVIKLYKDSAPAYFRRGETYFNTGCYDRAKQDLIRAIELGDPDAHDLLLEVQARLNQ